MSKGSWKRPVAVSHETYSRNFDRIFGVPKEDAVCKWCGKPIEDDVNGFCKSEYDDCWRAWVDHQQMQDQVNEE